MKKHIVCFGDSNTHGYCAEGNGDRFDEKTRWTARLQTALGEEYQIIEEGLSGRTTCFDDPLHEGMSGLQYIYPCLMSHEPVDLLVIMLGTNDTKERFGVSAECIALGLKRLVDKAVSVKDAWKNGVPNILIITPQNIGKEYALTNAAGTMGRGCAEKSEQLAKEYEKTAQDLNCRYLDANKILTVGPNEVDFMHLTAEGHRQLADALKRVIEQMLREK